MNRFNLAFGLSMFTIGFWSIVYDVFRRLATVIQNPDAPLPTSWISFTSLGLMLMGICFIALAFPKKP
ncbi:MAG: hypothetical protein KBD27_03405 [Candidatus Moranbacteria bacterium]|nr:hypothetical protein [Candidatus Moranbacteria bacterium]